MPADCVFCRIIDGDEPVDYTYRDDRAIGIVPLNPVTPGHQIAIPRRHSPDFTEDELTFLDTAYAAFQMARTLGGPCNLITSKGSEATQSVFHLHIHVVPRTENDGLLLPWDSIVFGHHKGAPKPFALYRRDGRVLVALGAEFPDGAVALRLADNGGWTTRSDGGANAFTASGDMEIVWLSDELEPFAEMEQQRDEAEVELRLIKNTLEGLGYPPIVRSIFDIHRHLREAEGKVEAMARIRAERKAAEAERDTLRRELERADQIQFTLDYALRLLVNLKDGPHDEAYERDKPAAWEIARQALVYQATMSERCRSCDHEMMMHHEEGCRYTSATGHLGRDLVCPCSVSSTSEPEMNSDG